MASQRLPIAMRLRLAAVGPLVPCIDGPGTPALACIALAAEIDDWGGLELDSLEFSMGC